MDVERAIARARNQSQSGPRFDVNTCLRQVRLCYGVDALWPDASTGWRNALQRHTDTPVIAIPRGVPVWWTGGSSGFGHVAISTGAGRCWSTDINRPGYFDRVPIKEISERWGLQFEGWTEDINGVTVWTPPQEEAMPEVDLTEDSVRRVANKVVKAVGVPDASTGKLRTVSGVLIELQRDVARIMDHLGIPDPD